MFPISTFFFFFFNDTATTEIYTLSLHDALPILALGGFAHIIAGSVDVLYLVNIGAISWLTYLAGFMLPTLIGNIIGDRKSTRLNSSHTVISYAVFCLRTKDHTSELQSHTDIVCRLLAGKKNKNNQDNNGGWQVYDIDAIHHMENVQILHC